MKKSLKSLLFALCVTFTQGVLAGVLFNDVDINEIITPEDSLVIDSLEYDNLMIVMEKGEMILYNMQSKGVDYAQKVKDGFRSMRRNKKKFSQHFSVDYLFFNSPNISFEHAYLKGLEGIFLKFSESLVLRDVLLEAPDTYLKGDRLEFSNCFVDGSCVHIEPYNDNSLVSVIKFTFKDKKRFQIPTAINADMYFKGNETKMACFVSGVSKVEIQFSPDAFIYTN